MIQAMILDDDTQYTQKIATIIQSHSHLFHLHIFHDIDHCITCLDQEKIDIAFLDIEIQERKTFEIVHHIHSFEMDTLIVYITDFPKYAKDCVGLQAIKFIEKKHLEEDLPILLKEIEHHFNRKNKVFTYTSKDQQIEIPLKYILSFKKIMNHVCMEAITSTGTFKKINITTPIYDIENKIQDLAFIKIDRGIIINGAYILTLYPDRVILKNGEILSISRRRKKEVIQQYHLFLFKYRLDN